MLWATLPGHGSGEPKVPGVCFVISALTDSLVGSINICDNDPDWHLAEAGGVVAFATANFAVSVSVTSIPSGYELALWASVIYTRGSERPVEAAFELVLAAVDAAPTAEPVASESVSTDPNMPTAEVAADVSGLEIPKGTTGARTIEIVDGDTIEVEITEDDHPEEGKIKTVRLIGIDAPTTEKPSDATGCYGEEAAEQVTTLLKDRTVCLEKDVSNTDGDARSCVTSGSTATARQNWPTSRWCARASRSFRFPPGLQACRAIDGGPRQGGSRRGRLVGDVRTREPAHPRVGYGRRSDHFARGRLQPIRVVYGGTGVLRRPPRGAAGHRPQRGWARV